MASLSTPINQIRSQSNNQLQQPLNQSSQDPNMPLQMPIYNPNISNVNIPNSNNNQYNNLPENIMPQQNINSGVNLVDDLLNELEAQPEYQQDINIAHTQYAMDNVNTQSTLSEQNTHMLKPESTHSVSVNSNSHLLSTKSLGNDDYNFQNNNKTLTQTIIDEIKPCIIVFILFIIFSLHQVNRIIFSFLPQLLLENGQLSLYAILLKAILATVLYYGFTKLL